MCLKEQFADCKTDVSLYEGKQNGWLTVVMVITLDETVAHRGTRALLFCPLVLLYQRRLRTLAEGIKLAFFRGEGSLGYEISVAAVPAWIRL